jgi:hypothetical protein
MELLKPGPFASCLEGKREHFNRLYAIKKRMKRQIDGKVFSKHLIEVVAPLVDSAVELEPSCGEELTASLYELSLDLVSRRYLGQANKYPSLDHLWSKTLPKLVRFLPAGSRKLVSALSNAVYNLDNTPGVSAKKWLSALLSISDGCSSWTELLAAGKVLSWRCGMAHYRKSALEVWSTLSKELKLATLGLLLDEEEIDLEALRNALQDPWWRPDVKTNPSYNLEIVGAVGGFRGFGGSFVSPPEVMQVGDDIFAFDDEACWSVHADCYGTTLQRFGKTLPDGDSNEGAFMLVQKSGKVSCGNYEREFDILKRPSSFVSSSSSLAVTLQCSHKVFIVAKVPKRAD